MNRRSGAFAVAAAVAFLATIALLPLATADHVYSHRYIVFGRVVDANDDPVPGLTVNLGAVEPFRPDGACADQPGTDTDAWGPTRTSPVTNEFGEFTFCYHIHGMSRSTPGGGIVRIDALGVEREIEFDGHTRHSYVTIKLDDAHPSANRTVNEEMYTVYGRLWKPSGGPIRIEGIRVYGDTLHNQPVTVNLSYNGKPNVTVETQTNDYGDFAVRVPVEERPTTGTVTVYVGNDTFTGSIAPTGVTALSAHVDRTSDYRTLFVTLGVVAAILVVGGGLWYGVRRARSAREESVIRKGSTRKRAKK